MVRFALISVILVAGNLQLLDVSSSRQLSSDVVQKGRVGQSWLLPTAVSSRQTEKSSYLQFFLVYPAGDLQLNASVIDGNSTDVGLYDKVPEKGDKLRTAVTIPLCAEEEGLDAHFVYLEMRCIHYGSSTLRVTAVDSHIPSKSISWFLVKKCFRGTRGDLKLFIDGEQITKLGRVVPPWTQAYIRADQLMNITLTVRNGNQKVEEIAVESRLSPVIRGKGAHGGIISDPLTFFLSFQCDADTIMENVTVRIHVPPYESIAFAYNYECPLCDAKSHRDHLPAIDIGSDEGVVDIVRAGTALSPYDSGLPVSASQYFSVFFIRSPDKVDHSALHITSNMYALRRRMLDPELECENFPTYERCQVTYRCISDGSANVTVTMPLRHLHQSVEFAYQKTCKRPKIAVTEEVVTDSTLAVVCVTVILLCIWVCACWQGYTAPIPQKSIP